MYKGGKIRILKFALMTNKILESRLIYASTKRVSVLYSLSMK